MKTRTKQIQINELELQINGNGFKGFPTTVNVKLIINENYIMQSLGLDMLYENVQDYNINKIVSLKFSKSDEWDIIHTNKYWDVNDKSGFIKELKNKLNEYVNNLDVSDVEYILEDMKYTDEISLI